MPLTWNETRLKCGLSPVASAHDPAPAIMGGACYMASLRRVWRRDRTIIQMHWLAVPSYNAGTGNILKAQARCGNSRLWPEIEPCLISVTGEKFSHETRTYVERISRYWRELSLSP